MDTINATAPFGGLDVVLGNAGVAPPSDTVLTIDAHEFERTVEINLLGRWRTVRATLPSIMEFKEHVVLVSSIYAFFNGAPKRFLGHAPRPGSSS